MHQTRQEFTAMERFFLFCSGSDIDLLKQCRRAEQIKHMGFGSLVLVPAVLALVSMSYALSTLEGLQDKLWLAILGGFVWSLIIFAFDRFIVSTHRRKTSDAAELNRPAFYLRFAFALILGIVISHPLVMMYFNGSVADQMEQNLQSEQAAIAQRFDREIQNLDGRIFAMDSLYLEKQAERNRQADIVAKEIDGEVIRNANGELETTGLRGKGPSAENKIRQLATLENELQALKREQMGEKRSLGLAKAELSTRKDSSMAAFSLSTDYLHQEMALEQLKASNPIVRLTQWFIIVLFVLVDLLPFIFKTFSTYGLYDKVLGDEEESLQGLDLKDRSLFWQEKVDRLSEY
ncbi:DUF4407 domain-containing protein [Cryomorphaceae bacterium 1068]|nr:DUF4407 domain-containing protein [Cryomorphaceae bacterium 1068]